MKKRFLKLVSSMGLVGLFIVPKIALAEIHSLPSATYRASTPIQTFNAVPLTCESRNRQYCSQRYNTCVSEGSEWSYGGLCCQAGEVGCCQQAYEACKNGIEDYCNGNSEHIADGICS